MFHTSPVQDMNGTAPMTDPDRDPRFEVEQALVVELERRIRRFAETTDAEFGGPLSTLELLVVFVAFVVLPGLVVWAFGP